MESKPALLRIRECGGNPAHEWAYVFFYIEDSLWSAREQDHERLRTGGNAHILSTQSYERNTPYPAQLVTKAIYTCLVRYKSREPARKPILTYLNLLERI